MSVNFSTDEDFARQLDSEDPLRHLRERFYLPLHKNGQPLIYFAGNSLGLMPRSARELVDEELDNWAKLGVDAHHATGTPWYTYHEAVREPTARLVGAKPLEVICMNSLTVNLHLMMATFYRPTPSRLKILMEEPAFPSDTYAIKTQIVNHGLDPRDALILARPRKNDFTVRPEDIIDLIDKQADQQPPNPLNGAITCFARGLRRSRWNGSAPREVNQAYQLSRISVNRNWVEKIYCHHTAGVQRARLPIVHPGTRASQGIIKGGRDGRCELRFSRTQRHTRRSDSALQHLSRSLAFWEDLGSASVVALSIPASLGILALKRDCERMQLCRHQSARDRRILFHELSCCVFIGSLKNRNAKCLVTWFRCSSCEDQPTRLGGFLKPNEMAAEHG